MKEFKTYDDKCKEKLDKKWDKFKDPNMTLEEFLVAADDVVYDELSLALETDDPYDYDLEIE